ncbi:ras-related protein Rab-17-like isoform X1 [Huso huso]|uniref:Ras-related protein Rab-17-like isoform X1 n=1 Tax=Huso huso TaxID=61971 RepID=A0ABR0ZKC2_HUSHU
MSDKRISKRGRAASGNAQLERKTQKAKMVLLGSSGVGKSSLALRFTRDEFKSTVPTVGCAYLTQMVCLHETTLRFEIWDTAGQEKYHSVTPLYYRGANAALVVYDITNRDTFVRAQCWLQELERQYIVGETVVALVGNKADLSDLRQVELQEAQNLAEKKGLLFMETSAKSGKKVSELFVAIAHRLLQNADDGRTTLMHWSDTRADLHVPESQESRESRESCCRL